MLASAYRDFAESDSIHDTLVARDKVLGLRKAHKSKDLNVEAESGDKAIPALREAVDSTPPSPVLSVEQTPSHEDLTQSSELIAEVIQRAFP